MRKSYIQYPDAKVKERWREQASQQLWVKSACASSYVLNRCECMLHVLNRCECILHVLNRRERILHILNRCERILHVSNRRECCTVAGWRHYGPFSVLLPITLPMLSRACWMRRLIWQKPTFCRIYSAKNRDWCGRGALRRWTWPLWDLGITFFIRNFMFGSQPFIDY